LIERHLAPPPTKGHVSVARPAQWWYVACRSAELGRRPLARTLLGMPLIVFRGDGGRPAVLLDRCPHRNVPLSLGRVLPSGRLECAYHGWQVDAAGRCRTVPGLCDEGDATGRHAPAFATVERDGFVWVFATPDVAPTGEPLALPLRHVSGYATIERVLDVEASVHATVENALDVPHTAFLHRGLFRGGGAPNEIRAIVRRWGDRVEAEYVGEPRPAGWIGRLLSPSGGTVEHWDRFLLPSVRSADPGAGGALPRLNGRIRRTIRRHSLAPTPAAGVLPPSRTWPRRRTMATRWSALVRSNLWTAVLAALLASVCPAAAADKPNIILILSDDFGYGDSGPYGGGPGRGMPTPSLDRLAGEGMTFYSFYAQPSCTPGRAAVQTGRIPNRSGMTTVAFQGQGGGLPAAEWTLGSVLKQAGYQTFFTGKWHLGEADYALPNAQGYDEMRYVGLYHLNAYTYGDPTWFPDMDPKLREFFDKVTKGALSGKAGEKATQDFKVNGQYVNTPEKGVVGIPFFDEYVEKASLEYLDKVGKSDKPFFMSINFMKVHQPNLPAPEFEHKSLSKTKYADSVVENDTRIGRIVDKVRALGLEKNTYVFWTTDNGAWQDVYPDAGYTPFRGTKGTVREGGSRVPAIAWGPNIKAGSKNYDIVGGLDFMATFAGLAGTKLPDKDREGKPIVFDSYDMAPLLFDRGTWQRNSWFYFTENELSPGAARVGNYKAVFNLRGDDGQATGGLAVDTNLGWKGQQKYVATVPQVFDLWQDPQERYDIFMNNYTERTWTLVTISKSIEDLMKTYVQYPPRKMQSASYGGPIEISKYQQFQWLRDQMAKEGVDIPLPTGN
jgi:arylsulfatase A-like enzyme/nitrite reductase/ring-hydroxylating ferredoxin subunit